MTAIDLRILCTALGFTSVIAADVPAIDRAERALALGRLIEAFCIEQNANNQSALNHKFVNETDTTEIDAALEQHIQELRDNEITHLPEDRATLLAYYDRLQHRKSRRTQSAFYAMADEATIANLVLRYLDEEIGDEATAIQT